MNTPLTFAGLKPAVFQGGAVSTVIDPTLTINSDGTVKYTPPTGFVGIDTATIIRCDGLTPKNCDTTTYIIKILPNLKDTVVVNTNMNTTSTVGTPITTLPGTTVTVTPLDPPHGTSTLNSNGTVSYKPDTNYVGLDTIKRIVCATYSDGSSRCDTITNVVRILPTISDATTSTANGTPATISAPNIVLGPGTTKSTSTTTPTNGTATVNPDGSITYTPKPGFVGIDTVKRIICVKYQDGVEKCDTSLILVKVEPKLSDTNTTTKSGTPITIGTNPILVAGPGTSINTTLTGPNHGTATVNANGSVNYTPNAGFVGIDTIMRIICVTYSNGTSKCDTSIITVVVTPDNATTNGGTTESGKPLTGGSPIIPGPGTTVSVVGSASNGTLVVNPNGTFTYTSNPGFSGKDTVKRIVCVTYPNGIVKCDTILTIIDVTAVSFEISNYFSPNGDGINDFFKIPDAVFAKYPNLKVSIYNKWGNIVWRSTGTYGKSFDNNTWYGQLEGGKDLVPDGVYYYLIELESEFKTTKAGFIEVMRQ